MSETGDSLENPRLTVRRITSSLASAAVVEHHYLHRRPNISHAFGLFAGDELSNELMGVCTFGTPASRAVQIGACRCDPSAVIELNRLWVDDAMPKNTESWFVSRCLRVLPAHIVVSYADTSYGHVGFIYRALSFRYAGWTDMERKTPRYDYIPHDPTQHSREASRSGYSHKVRRKPKVKYWTTTGTPFERRQLARHCTWPSYDWRTLPPKVAA